MYHRGVKVSKAALALLVAFLLLSWSTDVDAQRRRGSRGKDFTTQDTFGLGLMLGGPTGLSGKYWIGDDTAIDFGVGAHYRFRFHRAVQIHADWLLHPVNLADPEAFDLPLYFGIGGRLLFHEFDPDDNRDDHIHLGVRGPVGLAMIFNEVPIDIFFELALVLDIVVDDDDDLLFADLNGIIGFRYFFY
jgi:hypothetical protein